MLLHSMATLLQQECCPKFAATASVQELAALEAEAEAQALQEQQRRSAPAPSRDGACSYGSHSVSLHDNASQAEHAMVSHCCPYHKPFASP